MGLFKADLYRSFAVGFVLGALALLTTLDDQSRGLLTGDVIPAAQAATAPAE